MTSGRLIRTALTLGVIGLLLVAADVLHEKGGRMQNAGRQTHRNKLAGQVSPYLLQHADNPVNWMAWGPEAFALARRQDKPVFISIGYSTCHWCHVMEHESFENETIAAVLNEHFICVKVDREERPDIDAVYMRAVQMMTGQGGWPLSVFADAEGRPFFGGTYFPPRQKYGKVGFLDLLETVARLWKEDRKQLLASSDQIVEALAGAADRRGDAAVSEQLLTAGYEYFQEAFDPNHAGFGPAPKFPQPTALGFLLSYYHRTSSAEALTMVTKTLDVMAGGGVYDHLGGGFHRYATDANWLVPHFEKMLYDQALLAKVYVEAYQITGRAEYARVAREVFDYVLRDMTDESGGFHAAEDADSEGREGLFYVWRKEQVEEILGEKAAALFCDYYGVTETGNFERGASVLSVVCSMDQAAEQAGMSVEEAAEILAQSRAKLLAERAKRVHPGRDDKVITGWNGLMISALAYGGAALDEPRYVEAATRAASFILDNVVVEGKLARYCRGGKVVERAFLDDYAFMTVALLDLYEATFEPNRLVSARSLADDMIAMFCDVDGGGMFMTAGDSEELIVRSKPDYDGAVPAGNSTAVAALLRLGAITADSRYSVAAEAILKGFAGQMAQAPGSLSEMLTSTGLYLGPNHEIVIAAGNDAAAAEAMTAAVHRRYLPNAVILLHGREEFDAAIEAIAGFISEQTAIEGRATAYVCEDHACKEPVTDLSAFESLLDELGPDR